MEIDLSSPLTVTLNLVMAGLLAGSLLVVWNARRSVALVCFALLFSGAVGGVVIPVFAMAAALTVTLTDRNASRPPREHRRTVEVVLRHFRGRPDPVST